MVSSGTYHPRPEECCDAEARLQYFAADPSPATGIPVVLPIFKALVPTEEKAGVITNCPSCNWAIRPRNAEALFNGA